MVLDGIGAAGIVSYARKRSIREERGQGSETKKLEPTPTTLSIRTWPPRVCANR